MAVKKKKINLWQEHHQALGDAEKIRIRQLIQKNCEWSRDSFYRKKRDHTTLKAWEKEQVTKAYGVTLKAFFPDSKKLLTF